MYHTHQVVPLDNVLHPTSPLSRNLVIAAGEVVKPPLLGDVGECGGEIGGGKGACGPAGRGGGDGI